jgi:hypothetical protein
MIQAHIISLFAHYIFDVAPVQHKQYGMHVSPVSGTCSLPVIGIRPMFAVKMFS